MEGKRAKSPPQGTDEYFHSIFESAQIGIGILNTHTGEMSSNLAQQGMLCYRQVELSRLENGTGSFIRMNVFPGRNDIAKLFQSNREKDEWEQRFVRHAKGELKEYARNLEEPRRVEEKTVAPLEQLVKELEITKWLAEDATRAKAKPCP